MKHTKLTLLSVAVFGLALTAACTQTRNTNTATANQNMATPEPTPNKDAIVSEVTRIEKDWPRIWKEKDAAAVRRVEADDVILVSFNGTLGSKEQDVKDAEAGNLTFDSWDVSEVNVKVIDPDAAVASVLMTLTRAKFSDGSNTEDVSGHYRVLDTFARRGGQWQVVASSIVKLTREAEQALINNTMPGPAVSGTPATQPSPPARPSATRKAPPPPSPPTQ
jgi:ketosteroid isomerase-like protein